jgi:hypothetical protein
MIKSRTQSERSVVVVDVVLVVVVAVADGEPATTTATSTSTTFRDYRGTRVSAFRCPCSRQREIIGAGKGGLHGRNHIGEGV